MKPPMSVGCGGLRKPPALILKSAVDGAVVIAAIGWHGAPVPIVDQ